MTSKVELSFQLANVLLSPKLCSGKNGSIGSSVYALAIFHLTLQVVLLVAAMKKSISLSMRCTVWEYGMCRGRWACRTWKDPSHNKQTESLILQVQPVSRIHKCWWSCSGSFLCRLLEVNTWANSYNWRSFPPDPPSLLSTGCHNNIAMMCAQFAVARNIWNVCNDWGQIGDGEDKCFTAQKADLDKRKSWQYAKHQCFVEKCTPSS